MNYNTRTVVILPLDGTPEYFIFNKSDDFNEKNRKLALYVNEEYNEKMISRDDFSLYACDSYMLLIDATKLRSLHTDPKIKIEKIDKSQADIFCDVFAQAYSSDDPNDPYGKLPFSYRNSLRRSFSYSSEKYSFEYFMAEIGSVPSSVVSIIHNGSTAGVYGLGTIHQARRKGIGTALMKYVLSYCDNLEISTICLQTECGSHVENWYEILGFESVCKMRYYEYVK